MIIIHLTGVARRRAELALSTWAAAVPCGALALLSSTSQGPQITLQPESPRLLPMPSQRCTSPSLKHLSRSPDNSPAGVPKAASPALPAQFPTGPCLTSHKQSVPVGRDPCGKEQVQISEALFIPKYSLLYNKPCLVQNAFLFPKSMTSSWQWPMWVAAIFQALKQISLWPSQQTREQMLGGVLCEWGGSGSDLDSKSNVLLTTILSALRNI